MARRAKFGRSGRRIKQQAELDITSFMNLMIVLVPVLLMMMVHMQILSEMPSLGVHIPAVRLSSFRKVNAQTKFSLE